jgi:hypothetical protein
MIPQSLAIGFFIQYPNMILYMLCCDIQCNFGQIQICSIPAVAVIPVCSRISSMILTLSSFADICPFPVPVLHACDFE